MSTGKGGEGRGSGGGWRGEMRGRVERGGRGDGRVGGGGGGGLLAGGREWWQWMAGGWSGGIAG